MMMLRCLIYLLFSFAFAAPHNNKELLSIGNGVYVKETWILNLDRRPDRLEAFTKMAANISLDFLRFPVIDGHYLKHHQWHKLRIHPETKFNLTFWELRDPRTENERAVTSTWQSHLQTYFRIRYSVKHGGKDDPVLILEDDAVFESDARRKIHEAGSNLPADWEVFFLGFKGERCMYKVTKDLCRARSFVDLTGYIIRNASTADRILQLSNTDNSQSVKVADLWWLGDIMEKMIKFYLIQPRIITQLKGSRSDITPGKVNGRRVGGD